MYIGEAIEAIKNGQKITRQSWKKGSFIYMVAGGTVDFDQLRGPAKEAAELRTRFENGEQGSSRWICPHIDMISEWGQINCGWQATADDLFASDWQIAQI